MSEFSIERIYMPSVDQSNAIHAAADKAVNQDAMAEFYADCIRADMAAKEAGQTEGVDWKAVNAAILVRWPKGLVRIKTKAWRLLSKK